MPKPKKLYGRKCPLCTARRTAVKPHAMRAHLPWYFGTLTACWKCGVQDGKHCFLRAKHSNTESHPEDVLFGESGRHRLVHLINGHLHRICYTANRVRHFGQPTGFCQRKVSRIPPIPPRLHPTSLTVRGSSCPL